MLEAQDEVKSPTKLDPRNAKLDPNLTFLLNLSKNVI